MTHTQTPEAVDFDVTAEDAPLGVQLWPTIAPEFAQHYTLASVAVIRDALGTRVRWTYEGGSTRTFRLGERIACRRSAR